MLIRITNLFGSFEARLIERIYFGNDVAGFRAVVLNSRLDGWRNGEIIECGTLTQYQEI